MYDRYGGRRCPAQACSAPACLCRVRALLNLTARLKTKEQLINILGTCTDKSQLDDCANDCVRTTCAYSSSEWSLHCDKFLVRDPFQYGRLTFQNIAVKMWRYVWSNSLLLKTNIAVLRLQAQVLTYISARTHTLRHVRALHSLRYRAQSCL